SPPIRLRTPPCTTRFPYTTLFRSVGLVEPDLRVSSSGTDADWVVKLIDVYPDDYPDPSPNPTGVHMGGFQQLVRGDVMRGKFREDRKSTRLNSSHLGISYAVFCLK